MDAVLSMAPSEAAVVVQPSSDISGELVASADAAPSVTPDSLLTEASARESQVVVIVMPQSTANSDSDPSAAHDAFVAALDVVLEGSTIEDGIGLETTR
jgi:hypothetical protein